MMAVTGVFRARAFRRPASRSLRPSATAAALAFRACASSSCRVAGALKPLHAVSAIPVSRSVGQKLMWRRDGGKHKTCSSTLAALAPAFVFTHCNAVTQHDQCLLVPCPWTQTGESTCNKLTATYADCSHGFRHPVRRRLKKVGSSDGGLER